MLENKFQILEYLDKYSALFSFHLLSTNCYDLKNEYIAVNSESFKMRKYSISMRVLRFYCPKTLHSGDRICMEKRLILHKKHTHS
jgi:hypothetical protein